MPILEFLINPFSEEAKKFLRDYSSIDEIPNTAFEFAEEKLIKDNWKKIIGIEKYNIKDDILSFYLLFHACSLKGPLSIEAKNIKMITRAIVSERIWRRIIPEYYGYKSPIFIDEQNIPELFSQVFEVKIIEEEESFREVYNQLRLISEFKRRKFKGDIEGNKIKYAVKWTYLTPLLLSELDIVNSYLYRGYILLSLNELIKYFSGIIEKLVEKYILSKVGKIEADDRLKKLADFMSEKFGEPYYLKEYISKVAPISKSKGTIELLETHLKEEYFPPCIKKTLLGVSAGSRNYAITVLLTSFLSYARIAPIGAKRNAKISDYLNDISVIKNEILPIIYQAAENSSPPLFEDQPTEKMNIIYHLGFGLTEEPRLEDAGKSKWYFPPNCEKIRREAPSLCEPDEFCKNIKNPLSYYTKKLMREGIKVKGKIIEILSGEMRFRQKIRAKIKTEEGNRYIVIIKGKLAEKILGKKETSELLGKEFVFKGRKVGNKILVREIE